MPQSARRAFAGGERQRLGLARAFLHDAPFMLLDEPTSNLDSLNEAVILKSLQVECSGKTVVLVSHRKSTMGISKSSLYSLFHENFHCTIKEYVNKRRIERACHMLLYSNQSIEYISEFVGFSSGPYFSKVFKNIIKMSPIQYKKTQNRVKFP